MTRSKALIPKASIEKTIVSLRGHNVLLDKDLATLYGVTTSALNQAVTRNIDRFPRDFMFKLNKKEFNLLKSQIVTSSWGGTRKPPRAFTEQGVAMLSSVLQSKKALQVNIEIMRAFVQLRQLMATHADLARKLTTLEKKYDANFKVVFDAIRQLMAPGVGKTRKIGFERKKG